jgi:CheY-like chemotaxis protein
MTQFTPDKLNCRVLLVEDNVANRRLIAHFLQKAGAEVSLADNGWDAVELVSAAKQADCTFDVILMDVQMPVMDGHEATRQLRSAGFANPIIALTANATVENCQKCLDAGCNDYMTKPFNLSKLVTLVAKHLSQESLQT